MLSPPVEGTTCVDLQAVVHDLKNALAVLEGELERLVLAEGLDRVAAAHAHCSRLRQRLLAFLVVSSNDGSVQAHVEARAPEDFLREVAAGFVLPPGAPRLHIVVEPGCPAVAFFDDRLVSLALHAALANAVQFCRTRVRLGAAAAPAPDRGLIFWVEDDGPGWGSGATPGGSGLGTAICERVAAAHSMGVRRGAFMRGVSAAGGARVEFHLP